MNNFVIGLKRFVKDKNFVTVVLIIVVLGILYYGYSTTIKKSTNPVNLPVAAKTINPETEITGDDITYTQVANSMVPENVIMDSDSILKKYTNINVTIPQGSLFYKEWVVEASQIPGNWIEQLDRENGELGYYMDVDVESTLGNSVLPNTYIDIYMKVEDENGTIMFGKLLENVKVLVVHDESGKNIFANAEEVGVPSKIGFAVNQDLYILLKKADYLDINLVIAPRGSKVPSEDSIIVTSATLRDYIDAKTITIEEDIIIKETDNNKAENDAVKENTDIVEE